jgi:hypothetical protein
MKLKTGSFGPDWSQFFMPPRQQEKLPQYVWHLVRAAPPLPPPLPSDKFSLIYRLMEEEGGGGGGGVDILYIEWNFSAHWQEDEKGRKDICDKKVWKNNRNVS